MSNKTQWQYDALNRQVQEIDPLSNVSTMAFDAVDRLISATDRNAQLIDYLYDLLNREIGETWFNSSGTSVNLLTFTFDPNNNLLTAANNAATDTMSYDSLDRLSTMQDPFGTLQTSTYDAANNRLVLQDSFGGVTTRTFDALNRVATMQFSGQSADAARRFCLLGSRSGDAPDSLTATLTARRQWATRRWFTMRSPG